MDVSVENLTKRFAAKGTPAVFDASFTAPSGGITTLLGPSGSGKTTLLRAVAGLEVPDAGRILFGQTDVTAVPARRRGVGFVFQSFALFDHMTVRKNIAFGLEVKGSPAAAVQRRVDELLALVQLEGLGDRYPGQLSGGQRQRVGFARALAPAPAVLLLDEPFGALDARVRVELRQWLRRLHEATHLTTILVTHDQDEALELSDRLVVLDQGRILQIGAPQEVYDHPATSFVASFVGGANVLAGTVDGGRASVGPLSLAAPQGLPEGAAVRAVVRPHDIKIAKPSGTAPLSLGLVTRVATIGASVKVELKLPSGESVNVQITRAELEGLGIHEGDRVIVDLGRAKIFLEDYSI